MSYSIRAKADELYNEKQYEEAFRLYMKIEETDSYAQYQLGMMYRNGLGVEKKDDRKAIGWLTRSAESGSSLAQVMLGIFYQRGDAGVEQNNSKAFKFYRQAADSNHAIALYNLAYFYKEGLVVEKNHREVFSLYMRAAQQNPPYAPAQFMVGFCYDQGIGIEQNGRAAFNWYKKAADQDSFPSFPAMIILSDFYLYGIAVERDYDKAIEYLEKAHKMGETTPIDNLGIITLDDFEYSLGQFDSERRLGEAYLFKAKEDPIYYANAVNWLEKAIQKGNAKAMCKLGILYWKGIGVENNNDKAVKYFIDAANEGDSQAQYILGIMYCFGEVVDQEKVLAINYWMQAAKQGHHLASVNLKNIYGINTY